MFSVLALMWMVPASHAFCGTYVGQAGAGLYNQASQVVMVRQGLQTTLTLANDFEGDLEDFVLVVPVPLVLAEEDVDVVDPEIITRVETYSAPRLVQYSCDDFLEEDLAGTGYDGSGDEDGEGAISASVEAEFSAGEFDIVILSAEQSEGLLSWLNSHGYAVPAESTEILQEYIDGGSYFLAAKVDPADLPDGQTWLRPLQVTYSTSGMSLPLRLGALNSPGVQDLLVYVINDQAEGGAGIANYTEGTVEHECMVDLPDAGIGTDFADFWEEAFDTPRQSSPGALWTREYAWAPAWCDPCAGEPLTDEDVQALGFDGTAWDAFFTRLHLRFTPTQATQDLVLYNSGDDTRTQIRYILYDPALEDLYPICFSGWASDPGTCEEEQDDDGEAPTENPDDDADDDTNLFGCGIPCQPGMIAAVLGLLALVGRRRD